jgi:phage shock protein E
MPHTHSIRHASAVFALSFCVVAGACANSNVPANPRIDAEGFLAVAKEAASHRATRRISEADFLKMQQEPGTIVLDARSEARFRDLHVAGAVNLSFPDITAESLARLIPDKNTRVLIYCNNNFVNEELAFPTKLPRASLNLSTYTALYTYGYKNVYELAPLLDAKRTQLRLVGQGVGRLAIFN